MSRARIRPIYRDLQDQMPSGWCANCGAELWPYEDGKLCQTCKEDAEFEQSNTSCAAPSN